MACLVVLNSYANNYRGVTRLFILIRKCNIPIIDNKIVSKYRCNCARVLIFHATII